MQALDGPDLFPLAQERPGQPMHTVKVAILERPVSAEEVDRWAADVLTGIEPLRRRLAGLPLARPVWFDGGAPDVRPLVRHVALPAPGGEAELSDLVARLCGGMLEPGRPLWRLWHVTGLHGGPDAVILQVHHALADGVGSVALWEALADDNERPTPVAYGRPSTRELLAATASNGGRDLVRLPGRIGRLARASRASKAAGVVEPFAGPPTPFNREPEAARRCAFATLSLPRLRAVARAGDATVNEAYLTICGGALRRHLEVTTGSVPASALSATVPAALSDRHDRFGNAVTTLYVSLHSDLIDPAARLAAVRGSVAATRRVSDGDPRVLADLQRHPRVYRALVGGMAMAERRRRSPAYNLTVSNVRGPAPFSLLGVPVVELRSVGPLIGHLGLNLTAWSYGEDFVVGIHAYASAGDDLADLGGLLVDELDALEAVS